MRLLKLTDVSGEARRCLRRRRDPRSGLGFKEQFELFCLLRTEIGGRRLCCLPHDLNSPTSVVYVRRLDVLHVLCQRDLRLHDFLAVLCVVGN